MPPTSPISVSKGTSAQEISIHYLNPSKINRFFSLEKVSSALEELIQKIVDYYNASHKAKRYEKLIEENDQPPYNLLAYAQVIETDSVLTQWVQGLGSQRELTTRRIYFLFFYYRAWKDQREIFALTTGPAFHVVQKFSNYHFPRQVVRRLCDPEVGRTKQRPLLGRVLMYSEILKEGVKISDSEAINKLFTRLSFKLRKDSSIYQLNCFQDKQGNRLTRGIAIAMGLGLVRFTKGCHPNYYPLLLSHLSKIALKEETYVAITDKSKKTKQLEKDSEEFDYLDYLFPCDFSLVPPLEQKLIKYIYQSVVQDRPFPPFDFCHKHRSEFFRGTDHRLYYQGKSWDCDSPPSMRSMIEVLKKTPLRECKDRKPFQEALHKVYCSFSFAGEPHRDLFCDFIEGEMRLKKGEVYWRLHKIWFELHADYLGIIHREFRHNLKDLLILPGDKAFLPHKWPSPEEKKKKKEELSQNQSSKTRYDTEGIYNEGYLTEEGYYLGDKVLVQHIELFDLLMYSHTHLYLYHVKEGFGQKTRDACSQILNAAKLIRTIGQKKGADILSSFFMTATEYSGNEAYRKKVQEAYQKLGKKTFTGLFSRKTVFVYALVDEGKGVRLLSEEPQTTRVSLAGIKAANNKFKGKEKDIFQALQKTGYITPRGDLTSLFFSATQKNFSLPMLKVDNQRKSLYYYLSSRASKFDSNIAKLEILRVQKEVENLGFQFRICQIDREDYPLKNTTSKPAEALKEYIEVSSDELSDVDEEIRSVLRKELREGDPFLKDGITYRIMPTKADGACGLHALLGTEIKGIYQFGADQENPNLAARMHYVAEFHSQREAQEDRIVKCLVGLLKEYLRPNPSSFLKMVFENHSLLPKLQAQLDSLKTEEEELKQIQEDFFDQLINTSDNIIQENLTQICNISTSELQNNPKLRNTRLRNSFDEIMDLTENTPMGTSLLENRENLNTCDRRRERIYEEWVQNEEVIQAYLNACTQPHYYFDTAELGLAAWLFNKRVTVFTHRQRDEVQDLPLIDGPESGEEVIIFHKGLHYSRCEFSIPNS